MPPKAQCLNPVFTSWLEEMRDELDPNSNYWKVYNRAAKSMRAHPKYLEHPRECVEVKYVGPRIKDLLVKRFESEGIAPVQSQGKNTKTPQESSTPDVVAGGSHIRNTSNSWSSDEGTWAELFQQTLVKEHFLTACLPGSSAKKVGPKARLPTTRPAAGVRGVDSLSNSGSDLEISKLKISSQPQKTVLGAQRTTKPPKRTKSTPARPRLSAAILAPAATSDTEPESDINSETAKGDRVAAAPLPSFEPIVFPAGSFTVQLILDEREVKSTKNRDYMLNGLKKRGVDVAKRSLEVGDMCWVARLNRAAEDLLSECVLDYIVERKRMDDLKGSLLDGRFHEQKFRLKNTGISHVYYLVEDYDTERIARQWREQINTALSSTQVIDRFLLKETTSIEDTLDYLSILHKTIIRIYAEKSIYIIPPHLVKRHSFLGLKQQLATIQPETTYHTTYATYQELNRKNGFFTLQDCMARMLQCVRGLSEEKIAALMEHYPTPRSLYEAFVEAEERHANHARDAPPPDGRKGKKTKASSTLEPERMLVELGGEGRRKIGPALSKQIYELFMDRSYES